MARPYPIVKKDINGCKGRSQAGVKVAGKAMADGGEAAGAFEAQARCAGVVDGGLAVGVAEGEHWLRVGQRREAVQLDHVRRLKVLQIVVNLAAAGLVSRLWGPSLTHTRVKI